MDENRLVKSIPFSIENSICGFAIKSGFGGGNYIKYTDNNYWHHRAVLDSPFAGIAFESKEREPKQLLENKRVIDSIIIFIKSE